MAFGLGMDAKLYRNTGTFAVPIWDEIDNVGDLAQDNESEKADVTTRKNAPFKAEVATIISLGLAFGMIRDDEDADYIVLRDAQINRTTIEFAVMNGDITVSGNSGFRFLAMVSKFSETQNLADAQRNEVEAVPTFSDNPPAIFLIP